MVNIIETIVIERPARAVFSYVVNPSNDPVWISGIKSAEPLTPLPLKVGGKVKRLAQFLGKDIEYVLEVTRYKANELLFMKSIKSPFPIEVEYEFDDGNGKTLFKIHVKGNTSGFYSLAAPLMSLQVRRSLRTDLRNLKKILESAKPKK